MKHYSIIKMMAIVMMALSSFCASAPKSNASNCEGTVLIIRQSSPQNPNTPRTPVVNPFFASIEDTYVLLGSTSPYGVVSVTLVSTAGDNYTTDFDTEDWTINIPVSGNSGHYTLTLVAESGAVFVGEFDM